MRLEVLLGPTNCLGSETESSWSDPGVPAGCACSIQHACRRFRTRTPVVEWARQSTARVGSRRAAAVGVPVHPASSSYPRGPAGRGESLARRHARAHIRFVRSRVLTMPKRVQSCHVRNAKLVPVLERRGGGRGRKTPVHNQHVALVHDQEQICKINTTSELEEQARIVRRVGSAPRRQARLVRRVGSAPRRHAALERFSDSDVEEGYFA